MAKKRDAEHGSQDHIAQCELLRKILSYFFPEIGSEIDKSNLFHSLQSMWAEHEKTCMPTVDNSLDGHRRVLLFWIKEQQKRYEIRSKIGSQYANSTLEIVKRVLAINELRTLRLQWKAFGAHCENQYKTPEEILYMTFALMTKTEGMEPLFKEGLDRLIEEESDVLRPGDLTIWTITHSEEQHFRKRTPTSQPSFQAAPEERSLRPELD